MTDIQVEAGLEKTKTKAKAKKDADAISYDEAVTEGKQLVKAIKSNQMRLGELADRLEPKYGKQTLKHFAKEIGVKASTVERWRSVYRSRKGKPATEPESPPSVLKAIQGLPEPVQDEILKLKPTVRQAHTHARDYRAAHPEIQEDWKVRDARGWLGQAEKHAKDAIQYGHPASAHLAPAILRQAIDNVDQMLATLRAGGKALNTLADEVERALAPPTPPPMFDDATIRPT
jgi:transposase-like protein